MRNAKDVTHNISTSLNMLTCNTTKTFYDSSDQKEERVLKLINK